MLKLLIGNFDRGIRWLLYLLVLSIPIRELPSNYPIPAFLKNVPYAFLMILLLVTIIYYLVNRNDFHINSRWIKIYLAVCVIWPFISTIHGIFIFPYWDENTNEFIRNSTLVQKIAVFYPDILYDNNLLRLKFNNSLLIATIHNFLMPLLGIPFIFYVSFKDKSWQYILNVFGKAAFIAAFAMVAYSLVEIPWLLTGNQTCAEILEMINVHLYDVKTAHDWWPPLLWNNQLRSFTQEPSFFGIISVFIIPMLWYKSNEKKTLFLLTFFTYMIFMTKARTAQVIFLSEILLFLLFTFLGKYPNWRKTATRILGVTILSFLLYLSLPIVLASISGSANHQSLHTAFTDYVDKDVVSVGSVSKRSNMARWGDTVALFNVGIEHPIFGVGTGLESPYIADNIPAFAQDDREINQWLSMLRKDGWLKSSIPPLNEFGAVFARYGLVGLILFLLPLFGIGVLFFKYRNKLLRDFGLICALVMLAGQVACLFSNSFFLTYPLALTLVIILIFKEKVL